MIFSSLSGGTNFEYAAGDKGFGQERGVGGLLERYRVLALRFQ